MAVTEEIIFVKLVICGVPRVVSLVVNVFKSVSFVTCEAPVPSFIAPPIIVFCASALVERDAKEEKFCGFVKFVVEVTIESAPGVFTIAPETGS